jgi:hypothetical protein
MKKKILLIVRSNGCLERISAFAFFFSKKYDLYTLFDHTNEKINNHKLISLIKNRSKKIINFRKKKILILLRKTLIKFKILPLKYYEYFYKTKILKILNHINPDIIYSDLNCIKKNCHIFPTNATMLIRKYVDKKKIVSYKTGAYINNKINFYRQKPFFLVSDLIVSTEPEKFFFKKNNRFNSNVINLGELCYDYKYLTFLKKIFKIKKNSSDILFLFSNLSEVDLNLTYDKELDQNVLFIKRLIDFFKNKRKNIYIKLHPRVNKKIFSKENILSKFSEQEKKLIFFVNDEISALECIYKFKNIAMLFSSCLFQSIILKKNIFICEYLKKLNPNLIKKSKTLNYFKLSKNNSKLSSKIIKSNPSDPLCKFISGTGNYRNISSSYSLFLKNKMQSLLY